MHENNVDPDKYYSATEIMNSGYFPWIGSLPTLIRWIEDHPDLFKPVVRGTETGRRYKIKGETILEILRQADAGELRIDA